MTLNQLENQRAHRTLSSEELQEEWRKIITNRTNVICRLRSEINLLLVEVVTDRETSNALYYDRLCSQREKELTDPDDVLFDAEQRKKEIEEEQRKQEQDQKPTGPENPV